MGRSPRANGDCLIWHWFVMVHFNKVRGGGAETGACYLTGTATVIGLHLTQIFDQNLIPIFEYQF